MDKITILIHTGEGEGKKVFLVFSLAGSIACRPGEKPFLLDA
jgi:hypothetical protein